jgi:hypothetical protein
MEGVVFLTEINSNVKPLMWHEITDPGEWMFSMTYQIDLITSALGGYGGDDYYDYADDHEGFPVHMLITTVNPADATNIVWSEVDHLGFASFTVVYDVSTAEDYYYSSSYITTSIYDSYEGYRLQKEYFGRDTQLREGIIIETPPFIAPSDHDGSLFVVVVGPGNATSNLKFIELGKFPYLISKFPYLISTIG